MSFLYMPYPCSLVFPFSSLSASASSHFHLHLKRLLQEHSSLQWGHFQSHSLFLSWSSNTKRNISDMHMLTQSRLSFLALPSNDFILVWMGRVTPEGDLESPWVLRSLFAPVILFGVLPATPVQGDWQPAYKLLWRPCLDRKDVGVLVDDAAVWMELFYLFIYHYHHNFIIIAASFLV